MAPTLVDGDVVLAVRGLPVRVGSVVLVRWASRPGQLSVKRVVSRDEGGWCVRGDFAEASTDSRTLGPARVVARVTVRLWPRPTRLHHHAP